MRLRQILVFLIFACGVADSAQADERAWFFSENSLTEVAVTLGGREWTPTWAIALPHHQPNSPIVWGGGRYLVWSASTDDGHWLVRLDTRSRQLAVFPLALDGPAEVAIDRSTARLVVLGPSALSVVDAEQLSVLAQIAMPGVPAESRSLAVAQGRIFAGRLTADGVVNEVVVLDATTLAHARTIPGIWHAEASRDETRVYLQHWYPTYEAQVWEPGTLTLIHTGRANVFLHAVGEVIGSADRVRGMFSTVVDIRAYDRDSLDVMFRATVDAYSRASGGEGVLDLLQASVRSPVVLRSHASDYGVRTRVIHVFDPSTLTPLREMREAMFDAYLSALLMLAPPDPPAGLHAVVNGRTALLTWMPPPDISEYEVVVGSAPGLSNVATISTGGVPMLLLRDVPAGTYHVRVRARNELGAVESAETTISVP